MIRLITSWTLIATCLLTSDQLTAAERVPGISTRAFFTALNKGVTIVDARGTALYRQGHIPGTLDIGAKDFAKRLPNNKKSPIILYCGGKLAKCEMWRQGAKQLHQMGYAKLKHWSGGVAQWKKQGGPLDRWQQPIPPGLNYHDGTAYLIHVPTIPAETEPALLIWCHPSDGNPKPEFDWWRESALFSGVDNQVILLAPQARSRGWSASQDGPGIDSLITHIVSEYRVDPHKIVLGGHSSGGFFTYDWGLTQQQRFTALVPAAAFATQKIPRPHRTSAPSIHIYHSRNDAIVPFAKMEESRKQLERLRYSHSLVEDNQQHNIGPKLAEMVAALFNQVNK